jgi:hypothetical protein
MSALQDRRATRKRGPSAVSIIGGVLCLAAVGGLMAMVFSGKFSPEKKKSQSQTADGKSTGGSSASTGGSSSRSTAPDSPVNKKVVLVFAGGVSEDGDTRKILFNCPSCSKEITSKGVAKCPSCGKEVEWPQTYPCRFCRGDGKCRFCSNRSKSGILGNIRGACAGCEDGNCRFCHKGKVYVMAEKPASQPEPTKESEAEKGSKKLEAPEAEKSDKPAEGTEAQ